MKTIGLIGGMSFESSVEYYRIINGEVRKRLGGNNSAKIVMQSVNFQEIETLQFQGDKGWLKLNQLMVDCAQTLERDGADCIGLCTNLMHRTAPEIVKNIGIPFIHIVEITAACIIKMGLKKVGLLGAIRTMKEEFYKKPLAERYQLEVLTPEEVSMQRVSQIIYEELCQGKFLDSSIQFLRDQVSQLQDGGAEGVILGCTELPLVLHDQDAKIPLLNTTKLHAQALVDFALGC